MKRYRVIEPDTARPQRLPVLDSKTIMWIGSQQVVIFPPGKYDPDPFKGRPLLTDIRSGATRALPELPPLPELARTEERFSARSQPTPSPDGRWLLYPESLVKTLRLGDAFSFEEATRFRLVRTDGSQMLLCPQDASFPVPGPLDLWWLPDSSGWTCRSSRTGQFRRYRLEHLETPLLQALAPPLKRRDVLGLTDQGDWICLNPGRVDRWSPTSGALHSNRLELWSPASGKPLWSAPIRVPQRELVSRGNHDGIAIPRMDLARSGRFLLMLVERTAPASAAARREIWRLPVGSGSPHRVLSVDPQVDNFALAPDSRTLVLWVQGKAFVTTSD